VLQVILGILSLMILDGGDTAHVCGIALVAFWSGVFVALIAVFMEIYAIATSNAASGATSRSMARAFSCRASRKS
jgi:hypothetical protein